MTRRPAILLFLLIAAALSGPASAQSAIFPTVEGESLSGHNLVLPSAATGKIAVLIFGFSKASKKPTTVCAGRLASDFASQPSFVIYQLPVLENVPRFIRGGVISKMRKDVPEGQRDRFVPILHGESDLKKLVHFSESNEAYAVLLDREGKILFQEHGMFDDGNYSQLRIQVQSALEK